MYLCIHINTQTFLSMVLFYDSGQLKMESIQLPLKLCAVSVSCLGRTAAVVTSFFLAGIGPEMWVRIFGFKVQRFGFRAVLVGFRVERVGFRDVIFGFKGSGFRFGGVLGLSLILQRNYHPSGLTDASSNHSGSLEVSCNISWACKVPPSLPPPSQSKAPIGLN